MFNTKDITTGSGKAKPVIGPGNQVIRINSITLEQTPYDKEAFNVMLHVETQPVGGDFEGFLKDQNNPTGPRYEGQVGRVRMSPYAFKDTTLPTGRTISRDTEILKSMVLLAETTGKREELDTIQAQTIEEFIAACTKVLGNSKFFNACIGGREWENKEGYINHDLFLPRPSKDGTPIEALDVENPRILKFNKEEHIKPLQKKSSAPVDDFNPFIENGPGSDFDL